MATSKSAKKPASKVKSAAKAPTLPSPSALTKAAPSTASNILDLASFDPSRDGELPDANAATVIEHARTLAKTVRTLAAPLKLGKVTSEDAERLDALAATLASAESAWKLARAKGIKGALQQSRDALTEGRADLAGALRTFVKDNPATLEAVDSVGEVEDDADLADDVRVLLPLARKHADALLDTEITPAFVDRVEATLKAFDEAQAGARALPEGETTQQALDETARHALAQRNRAFWALATQVRAVSERGRFVFRRDPGRRAQFVGYIRAHRAAKKPAEEKPAPDKPQG